jgi:hypothetical protein
VRHLASSAIITSARAHGSPRITEDLDICYEPSRTNVEKLAALLREWRA